MTLIPGLLHTPRRAKQLNSFEGLKWGTITPTDLDGLIDFHDRAFAFIEIKGEGIDLPVGQKLALTRIVGHLERGGLKAALFVAEHYVRDPDQQVDASRCRVQRVYTHGSWTLLPETPVLRAALDDFFAGRTLTALASPVCSDAECQAFYRRLRQNGGKL